MLLSFFIFIFILFLYIHIIAQYKKGEDLEIYEMDYTNNSHLQEVCDLKQPVLFDFQNILPELFQEENMDYLNTSSQSLKIKDCTDNTDNSGDYITLPFRSGYQLIQSDSKSRFFSENNQEFSEEKLSIKLVNANLFLKPTFVIQTKYDIMFGAKNTYTPLRYHTEFRKFLCVKSGKVHIKMTPYKSHPYLYTYNDYVNYEFRSPIDVWKTPSKYTNEMEKLKFLEFDVNAGHILYIPPYWYYSMKYSDEPSTIVYCFTYNSIMNCVANLPKWSLYFIEQQNTTKKNIKKMEFSEPNMSHENTGGTPSISLSESPQKLTETTPIPLS